MSGGAGLHLAHSKVGSIEVEVGAGDSGMQQPPHQLAPFIVRTGGVDGTVRTGKGWAQGASLPWGSFSLSSFGPAVHQLAVV